MESNSLKSPVIFDYLDFRSFLKDYYQYQKNQSKVFSYRNFARAGGIPDSSASILAAIIKGTRNLSQSYTIKFAIAMKLKEREVQYFKNLVQFNQSKFPEEKNYFFSLISKVRGSRASIIKENQKKFYSRWYYSVVWNYLNTQSKKAKIQEIANNIFPSISINEVKESIQILTDLGLIRKLANGYEPIDKHLSTGYGATGEDLRRHLLELIEMSTQVFGSVPYNKRMYSTLVFSVSSKGFSIIRDRLSTVQEEIREILERDEKEDRVYTLNMQLFPNSKVF